MPSNPHHTPSSAPSSSGVVDPQQVSPTGGGGAETSKRRRSEAPAWAEHAWAAWLLAACVFGAFSALIRDGWRWPHLVFAILAAFIAGAEIMRKCNEERWHRMLAETEGVAASIEVIRIVTRRGAVKAIDQLADAAEEAAALREIEAREAGK